jgi:hypothetical protein
MGLSPGIARCRNSRIFNEPAGLWLVDGFRRITQEPLGRFWWNLACTHISWIYRLGLLDAEIRAYLMSLLDCDWSMVSEGYLKNPRSDFDVIGMHAYLMGLSPGIARCRNPRIINEPAGLWLVDGFRRITREPLVRFRWNLPCKLISWVYRLGLPDAEIHTYLMSLLDSDRSMVSEG